MKTALQTRYSSYQVLSQVLFEKKTTDMALLSAKIPDTLSPSDRHFIQLLVLTVLRRYGQAKALLKPFLKKPLPAKLKSIELILIMGVVQLYFLKVPPHASVDTSVELVKIIKKTAFTKLVNAVLHAFVKEGLIQKEPDISLNMPQWLLTKWYAQYGKEKTRAFCESFLQEPFLDISVKENPQEWAKTLQANLLPTGTLRCSGHKDIPNMAGFQDGAWWVQEASAALPAQLFDNIKALKGADLCAAPGGKTAQLAVQGAFIDAFEISPKRVKRLEENIKRLHLEEKVRIFCQDATTIEEKEQYDFVLLDAPCSATGTIRKHPDLIYHLESTDVERLRILQKTLLKKAIHIVKKGGQIVYSTCSLNQEENESVVEEILKEFPNIKRVMILKEPMKPFLNDKGAVAVTPDMDQDGFYAVLLQK